MNIKKTLTTFGILLIIALSVFFFMFIFPWLALWFGLATLPNPPKPEITYGEFPFCLTYELDGEIKIIEDTVICEFDGYGERTTAGQSRRWRSHLKSENDKAILEENKTGIVWVTLLDARQTDDVDRSGNNVLELYFFGGNGHYYMGDTLGDRDRNSQGFDYISYIYQKEDGTIAHGSFESDVAWEMYKIKLISWEVADPIENTFK